MPRLNRQQRKLAKRILKSNHKNKVTYTISVEPNGFVKLGTAYYLDNVMVKMKYHKSKPVIENVKSVYFNKGTYNTNPITGGKIPDSSDIVLSYHANVRKDERVIDDTELYFTIVCGLWTNQSDAKKVRRKYHLEDKEVVVEWNKSGVEVVSVWSIAPVYNPNFISRIPELSDDLIKSGAYGFSATIMCKDILTRLQVVDPVFNQQFTWLQTAYQQLESGQKFAEDVMESIRQIALGIQSFIRTNCLNYWYRHDHGLLRNYALAASENYTLHIEILSKSKELTDRQKQIFKTWGLKLHKAWDQGSFNAPNMGIGGGVDNVEDDYHRIILAFDMTEFCANPHRYARDLKKCKLGAA